MNDMSRPDRQTHARGLIQRFSKTLGWATLCALYLTVSAPAAAQEADPWNPVLGSATADQVYTPVTPCRFVDGINADDRVPVTTPNGITPRYYRVRGNVPSDFVSQGAAATAPNGCGIPLSATAVMVNLTAADPDADGDLKVDPSDAIAPSSTSALNYTFGGARGKNLANAVIVKLCDLTLGSCASGGTPKVPTRDMMVTFHAGASPVSTYFIADVLGYFAPATGLVTSVNSITGPVTIAAGSNVTVTPSGNTLTIGTSVPIGSGTVTSVATGAGLSGGPITTSGTVSVANGGITSAMIANGAVGAAQIANGAVGSAQVNTAQVQTRVTSACPPGVTIQTINPDGTVVCQTATAQTGFSTATVDSVGNVGENSSIATGADGLGLISYYDSTNADLKVAHCENAACTAATVSTLDSTGTVGWFTSIAIGADGLGLISYYDATNGDLKVAHCSNAACTTATVSTLDSAGSVGYYSSITIGSDGLGLISYYDNTNNVLKVAHCSNVACTTATTSTLDGVGNAGWYTSITIGTDGLGLISYHEQILGDLKVAHCSNVACTTATISALDSSGNVGGYTSITIGADGLGLISYYDFSNGDLKVAHCSNVACTTATISALDSTTSVGETTSIALGADGLGLISYYDFSNTDLKVAHCSNAACTTATIATLDSTGTVGLFTSIAKGADGLGIISYQNVTNGDLRVAHCPNLECRPAVTSVAGGAGLVSNGTQGSTATLSVNFAGTGAASTVARSDHDHDAAYSALSHNHNATYAVLSHNHDAAYSLLSHNHFGQSWSGTAQSVFGLTGSNTGGSWFNMGNSSTGAKTWNLISTGSTNSEGVGKFLFRSQNDSSVVMALDGATAPWVGIGTSSRTAGRQIETSSGAHLTTGGAWTNSSDRNLKENLTAVAGDDVLARLAKLPVYRWNYRAEPDSRTHIGPMAQDFEAAFGLGGDSRSISTIDPAGIALAAIQELNRKTEALAAKQSEIDVLKQQVADLAATVRRLALKDPQGVQK